MSARADLGDDWFDRIPRGTGSGEEEVTHMADLHEAYEDRRTALLAAANALHFTGEDLTARSEQSAAAVVAFADLIHTGYFPTSELISRNASSSS
jgi:hypothetical protein